MSDIQAGKDEILRELMRAKVNIEGLVQRNDLSDANRLKWVEVLLGVCISYLEEEK